MKTALVTGASGGIGSAICKELLINGWSVVGLDVSNDIPDFSSDTAQYRHFISDLTNPDALASAYRGINDLGLSLDGIICATGAYDHFPLAEASKERLTKLLAINVLAVANLVSVFFPLINKENGRVVIIGSETGMVSLPFQAYGLSKRMLEVYVDALRQELSFIDIPVILIRPGAHHTALLKKSREDLAMTNPDSLFTKQLQVVRDRGQAIIDKGAHDPSEVAKMVVKALTSQRPRRIYHVHVSSRFYIMSWLPRKIREAIFRFVLG